MPKRPAQHPKLRYKDQRRPVGTWVLRDEWDRLYSLAGGHGVTLAVYLRALVVDALVEDVAPTATGQSSKGERYDFVNRCRPVSTWVLKAEQERLQLLANAHGMSLSTYLRAVIADVLAEEAV